VTLLLFFGLSLWFGAPNALAQAMGDSAAAESPQPATRLQPGEDGLTPRPAGEQVEAKRPDSKKAAAGWNSSLSKEGRAEFTPPRPPAPAPNLDYFIDEDGDGIGDGRLLRLPAPQGKTFQPPLLDPRLQQLKKRRESLRRRQPRPLRPPRQSKLTRPPGRDWR
jgi:hypothetical protein